MPKLPSIAWAMALAAVPLPVLAEGGTPVTLRGEMIDTWCYYSGVMGGPDAVVGSAHHTCAMWCSAGGIPVGLLAEDGTVYMVLKLGDDTATNGGDALFALASDTVTVEGTAYARDGINYLTIARVTANEGIVNATHEEYGVVPPFAIPEAGQ